MRWQWIVVAYCMMHVTYTISQVVARELMKEAKRARLAVVLALCWCDGVIAGGNRTAVIMKWPTSNRSVWSK